jgi:hypothetical protein
MQLCQFAYNFINSQVSLNLIDTSLRELYRGGIFRNHVEIGQQVVT